MYCWSISSTSLSDTLLASLSCRKTALHLSRFFSFTVDPVSLGSKNDKFHARAKFKGDLSIIFCTIVTKTSLNCTVSLSVTFFFVFGPTALFNSFSALNPTSILLSTLWFSFACTSIFSYWYTDFTPVILSLFMNWPIRSFTIWNRSLHRNGIESEIVWSVWIPSRNMPISQVPSDIHSTA